MQNGAALAGCRVADDHVPRQFIQRRLAARLAHIRRLQRIDRGQHALAQARDFRALAGAGAPDGIIRLMAQEFLQHAACASGQHLPYQQRGHPCHKDADNADKTCDGRSQTDKRTY